MANHRAYRVRVFRSLGGDRNIAHLIEEATDEGYQAHCGIIFDPLYERPTDYRTRLCINCTVRKDRMDTT